jgi:hypothetical protein
MVERFLSTQQNAQMRTNGKTDFAFKPTQLKEIMTADVEVVLARLGVGLIAIPDPEQRGKNCDWLLGEDKDARKRNN